MLRFIIAFFLVTEFLPAQKDSIVVQTFYSKGRTKSIAIYKGIDTVLVLKYYKGGQIKDSAHVTLKNDKEFYFGTQRSYYKSGQPASVTWYKNGYDEYARLTYRENGQLLSEIRKPGERKFYDKKGIIYRQLDINHDAQVYVPKRYRNGKHLKNTNYPSRIKVKQACLTFGMNCIKLKAGYLISLVSGDDTAMVKHCMIEGFSNDTIFISKFNYSGNIKRDDLEYESTIALPLDQLKTVYYSKNYTRKKYNRASIATLGGMDLVIVPLVASPFAAASLGTLAPVLGGCIVVGIPSYFYGKHLFKKMVPQRYEMNKWKIKPVMPKP